MYHRINKIIIVVLLVVSSTAFTSSNSNWKVLGIRVDFLADENDGTTGNGKFLLGDQNDYCGRYTIDPPPHDKSYFKSQIKAINSYFQSASKGNFGIDLINSAIYPLAENEAYTLSQEMSYYHPLAADLDDDERTALQEERITQLFYDAVNAAYENDNIDFNQYDVVVVFHAGISQDFNIDLDPTPEDIPSTFITSEMIQDYIGTNGILIGDNYINSGIILPETQNHILYYELVAYFQQNGVEDVCEYQYGLTGTFALMIGQAIGMPLLWNTDTGLSGVGVFGLMDQGSNNGMGLIPALPTAWSRINMDWEEAEIIIPDQTISVESQPNGNVIQVEINENEYYLIENRTNWFRSNVSLDSAQLAVYNQVDTVPNVINFIFDSIGVEFDENGVITNIPDYDLGLPGSGLLIWHINGSVIEDYINNNTINNNPKLMGVDLEEAGGPQDIGYVTTALFRDPSIGEIYDIWYSENPEYREINSSFDDVIEFNPFTYPNTKSSSGATSNLTIGNIGSASDTMHISISNNLSLPGFPDSSFHIIYHTDYNGNGTNELIGGTNELWWSETEDVEKKPFYELPSNLNYFTISNLNNIRHLAVLSNLGDSLKIVWFKFDDDFEIIRDTMFVNDFESITHIIGSEHDDTISISEIDSKIRLINSKNNIEIQVSISQDGGITVNDDITEFNEIIFEYIAAIDLDNDGNTEIVTVDSDGKLYSFNRNLRLAVGFPVSYDAVAPVLAKNIIGDEYPEIVFKNDSGDLFILNYQGKLLYHLSGNKNSKLIMLGEYNNRNTVVTESNIWIFDEVSENGGNEWTSWYGDESNSSNIVLDYFNEISDLGKLFDKKKTYVYPNPVRNNIAKIRMFNYSADKVEIKIYDTAGYFVNEIKENINVENGIWETEWNVSTVESGVYLIRLTALNGNNEDSVILKVGVIH